MVEPVENESGRGLSSVAQGAVDDRSERPSSDNHREDGDGDDLGTPGKDVVACDVRGTMTLKIPTAKDGHYAIVVRGPANFHYETNGTVLKSNTLHS